MKKILKFSTIFVFVIYLIFLLLTLFFRNNSLFDVLHDNHVSPLSAQRLNYSCNFIPFRTIGAYCSNIIHGKITIISLINLLGNLILFLPMGFFLPILFSDEIKTFIKFIFVMIIMIVMVEFIQFFTAVGSADIDDLILNLIGAIIGFFITKIPIFRFLRIK